MANKTALSILSLSTLFIAEKALSDSSQIPEGKLTDYPCVYPDITPGAGPRVINGCDIFITADYLYWSAHEDNLEYAVTGNPSDLTESTRQGSVKNTNFRYQTGFRGGLGFSFDHDLWDSDFNYTWFQSNKNKGHTHVHSAKAGLFPSFTPALVTPEGSFFSHAKTIWQLHFNSLDWELGRNLYISKYLSIRPFIGLKGTWQQQKDVNNYKLTTTTDYKIPYQNLLKSYFFGVGARGGINTSWHLSGTWSFIGDLALSGVWGQFNTHRKDYFKLEGEDKVTSINKKNHFNTIIPVLELCLGIKKDAWFSEDRFHISVQAGWEEQIWWDQNKFSLTNGVPRGGDLTIQGLTARIRIDF